MKRILLLSGRYLRENTHRELRLKEILQNNYGYEVIFCLPSRQLNLNGYTDDMKDDPVFKENGAIWLERIEDYEKQLRRCDAVVFGSWKSYDVLTQIAHLRGKPTINFNTTSGLDHWPHGVDLSCVKGPFAKRILLYLQDRLNNFGDLREEDIIITGSIIHEHYGGEKILDRDTFFGYYDIDPDVPVVVLFPKGIGSFRNKINAWFPNASHEEKEAYNKLMLDKYANICRAVKDSGCNLIVKMHPTAYTAYMCRSDEEYAYWNRFPWAKVLKPEHTYSCYKYATCGIGITTHSAMDMAYYNKPFIYVDSDKINPPEAIPFHVGHLCKLPKGPSSHWHTKPMEGVNPWFPSWLGYFCRVEELSTLIKEKVDKPIDPKDREMFIQEFWYKNDGRSSERIASVVSDYIERWDSRKRIRVLALALKEESSVFLKNKYMLSRHIFNKFLEKVRNYIGRYTRI
ncbi:MAG: hypothetical protein D6828_00880, partial [Nitrospirae bacterium]